MEIDQWIDIHIHSNNGRNWNKKRLYVDYSYIIVDDDNDMLLEQKDNFVQTDPMIGLTAELSVVIIDKLNKTIQVQ